MFTPLERLIFRYAACGKEHLADPLAVRRALLRHSAGQFWSWRNDCVEPAADARAPGAPGADGPEPPEVARARSASLLLGALDAQERVLGVVRAAFGLPDFDAASGSGALEQDCWDVLAAYEEYLEKNARGAGNSPTTSPADSPPEAAGS